MEFAHLGPAQAQVQVVLPGVSDVLVEHDVSLVADFTERTYVLDSGALTAEGSTAGVLADPAVRRAYLGSFEVT